VKKIVALKHVLICNNYLSKNKSDKIYLPAQHKIEELGSVAKTVVKETTIIFIYELYSSLQIERVSHDTTLKLSLGD